jgi:Kinesin motor domain
VSVLLSATAASINMKANTSNVRVVARIRPLAKYEIENGSNEAVTALKEEEQGLGHSPVASLVQIDSSKGAANKSNDNNRQTTAGSCGANDTSSNKRWFEFDAVFDGTSSQNDVYVGSGAQESIVTELFNGFNTTILAYGQTGAGKTHTMGGTDGLIPRCCHDLFQTINTKCDDAIVEMSYLEIYNEEIRDLLAEQPIGAAAKSLRLRETMNGDVFAEGLVSRRVTCSEQIHAIMDEASTKRVVAATAMNATSSRSHAMAIIKISGILCSNAQESKFTSKLTLVDLAGSERIKKTGAAGDRRSEGININKSLLVLGQVVSALAEQSGINGGRQRPKRKPPYRDSKLTRLLQDSLGGNSKTIMIACVSPADYNLDESINTLRYATTARSIQNTATQNIVQSLSKEEVAKVQRENQLLKLHVEELQRSIRLLSEPAPKSAATTKDPILSPTTVINPMNFEEDEVALNQNVMNEKTKVVDLEARVKELEYELNEYKSDFRKAAGDSILELPALKVEVEQLREDVKEMEKVELENEELRQELTQVRADAHAAQVAASRLSSIMDKLQELKGDELDKKRMTYNHIKKEEAWVKLLSVMLLARRDEMKNLEADFGLVVRVLERCTTESSLNATIPVESAPDRTLTDHTSTAPQRSYSEDCIGKDIPSPRRGWFKSVVGSGRPKKIQHRQGFDDDAPAELRQLLLSQHVNFFHSKMEEISDCITVEEKSLWKIQTQLRREREELETEIGMDEFVKDSLSSEDEGLLQQLTTVLIGPVHRV